MFNLLPCFDTDDEVRRAFREQGPFSSRFRLQIPNEDLEAYLRANYDGSDGSESAESVESCNPAPPLEHPDWTTYGTFGSDRDLPRPAIDSCHEILLRSRQRGGKLSTSTFMGQNRAGIICVVLSLVLLGTTYLVFPMLKEALFSE